MAWLPEIGVAKWILQTRFFSSNGKDPILPAALVFPISKAMATGSNVGIFSIFAMSVVNPG